MSPEKKNDGLSEELAALQATLSSLRPKPSSLDRDRVMFLAGQAAAQRRPASARWAAFDSLLWPCATASSLLLAATFGAMLLLGGTSQQRVVHVEAKGPDVHAGQTREATALDETARPLRQTGRADYLKLLQLVMTEGVDALPEPKSTPRPRREVPTWTPGRIGSPGEILGG
jgi:hypothetical protein